MINLTKVCEFCGEEYHEQWGHECEGTRRAAAEKAALEEAERDRIAKLVVANLPTARFGEVPVMVAVGSIHDPVNSPKHYTSHPSGVECIDITKHYNFQIGNAMKYLWRQGLKDEVGLDPVAKQIQDCEKAIWYIQSYINDLKKGQPV